MKHAKFIPAIAVAAAALMCAGLGTASATVVTNEGSAYTGAIHASSVEIDFDGAGNAECGKSTLEFKVESHGASVTAAGKVSKWTFGECTAPVEVWKAGSIEIHTLSTLSGGDGTVTSTGAEIAIQYPSFTCIYTTKGTDLGVLDDGAFVFSELDVEATLPRTGGSFFCGSIGVMTGEFMVTPPVSVH
jgi:hypothetical protein